MLQLELRNVHDRACVCPEKLRACLLHCSQSADLDYVFMVLQVDAAGNDKQPTASGSEAGQLARERAQAAMQAAQAARACASQAAAVAEQARNMIMSQLPATSALATADAPAVAAEDLAAEPAAMPGAGKLRDASDDDRARMAAEQAAAFQAAWQACEGSIAALVGTLDQHAVQAAEAAEDAGIAVQDADQRAKRLFTAKDAPRHMKAATDEAPKHVRVQETRRPAAAAAGDHTWR